MSRKCLTRLFCSVLIKFVVVIIEQLNVLESENSPQYNITIGKTSFNEFILAYPSGNYY